MKGLLNWEAIYECSHGNMMRNMEENLAQRWGRNADMYNQMARMEREYTQKQIAEMILTPEDTVLDIGCGPGRLSVPIAKKVKSVTALDVAPRMLAHCERNAREAGLDNVDGRILNWNDAVIGENIEQHDVAFASRSVGMRDIIKINAVAKKHVYILSFARSPSLKQVRDSFFYGVSDDVSPRQMPNRMFGYNVLFNMVYDMGAEPSVKVITDGFHKEFKSRQEAYDDLRTLCDVPADKEDIYRANVDRWLSEREDGGVVFKRETKTFVLHWEPINIQ